MSICLIYLPVKKNIFQNQPFLQTAGHVNKNQKIMKKISVLHFTLLAFLLITACDQLLEDMIPAQEETLPLTDSEKSLYIQPGGEVIIDLAGKLKISSNARVEVGANPLKGKLEFLEGGLLRYAASPDFKSGTDLFVLKILQDSVLQDQDTIQIEIQKDTLAIPCWYGAVSDVFFLWKDSLDIKGANLMVMKNDYVCDSAAAKIEIFTKPKHGTAQVLGHYIHYTPGPGFNGSDYFVYKLLVDPSDSRSITLGSVTISAVDQVSKPDTTNCSKMIVANDDYLVVSADSVSSDSTYTAILDVLANDSICSDLMVLGVDFYPFEARHEVRNNVLYYTYPKNFSGLDSLGYTICNYDSICDRAFVVIDVK